MKIGKAELSFLGHSGFCISNGKTIVIDPYNISDGIKADLILITHSHYDHFSLSDIQRVVKRGTIVVCAPDCQSKVTKLKGIHMELMEIGDEIEVKGIKINAFPAYNLNKKFHPKDEGFLGFVLKMDDIIIYHAGDTDKIPEMQRLTGYGKHGNKFVALLPVSGSTVMNSEQAAEAAELIRPDIAIPMHYGAGVVGTDKDARKFVELCKEKGIDARILEKK